MNLNYDIVRELIEYNCDGVDKYIHNNSTWLIFTDNKKWVIELTKDGTLWYNYNFFKDVFKYLSLDVVENQNYITKWVEETIITGVRNTSPTFTKFMSGVEDTIINGVKDTSPTFTKFMSGVEDTIINGVKHTIDTTHHKNKYVEDAIKNGVKETIYRQMGVVFAVEDTIQNGVKHTEKSLQIDGSCVVEDVIQNGIKETKTPGEDGDILGVLDFLSDNNTVNIPQLIDDVIKNGVKRTEGGILFDETKVDRIISEGVKETKLGAPDNRDYFIKDIIQNGVKHTEKSLQIDGSCVVEDVIQNGIKETHDDVYHHKGRVGGVIKNGIKETKLIDYSDNTEFIVNGVISRGIKE